MVFRKLCYWIAGVSASIIVLVLCISSPIFFPTRSPCRLPSLASTLPITTISVVGAGGYYQDICPAPLAQEMLLERPYGAIRLQWWGSPHRLYMVGTSVEGQPLGIRGPRVEAFEAKAPGSILAEYSDRVTFAGRNSVERGTPQTPESFNIDIYDRDQLLEQVELRYVPTRCDCVFPL